MTGCEFSSPSLLLGHVSGVALAFARRAPASLFLDHEMPRCRSFRRRCSPSASLAWSFALAASPVLAPGSSGRHQLARSGPEQLQLPSAMQVSGSPTFPLATALPKGLVLVSGSDPSVALPL